MFCRNCNKELLNGENVCTQCGAPAGEGVNYCSNCGTYTPAGTTQCARCGATYADAHANAYGMPYGNTAAPQPQQPVNQEPKSRLAVGLVAVVFGAFGIHNFYLGNKSRAIAQLLMTVLSGFTCGITALAAAIWSLVEGIQILSGSINYDAYGIPFKS